MNRLSFFLPVILSLLGSSTSLYAQQVAFPDEGLLWEIRGNGLPSSSFLFGTMHVMAEDSFFIPGGLGAAIADTRKLVLEVSPENEMNGMFSTFGSITLPEDSTLDHILSPEEYDEVAQFMEDFGGLPSFLWERIFPILTQQMIPPGACPDYAADRGKTFAYEGYLVDVFRQLGRPAVGALETMEAQLDIFTSIPLHLQVEQLLQNVRSGNEHCDELSELVSSYRMQDLSTLERILLRSYSLGEFIDQFIYQRNRNWIPLMENFMMEGPTFFAVGAGHLPGEEGVIMLLRRAGYDVTRVM